MVMFIVFLSLTVNAQSDNKKENLMGLRSQVSAGLHFGIFDSNQSVKYPLSFGVAAKYEYIPNMMKNFFIGSEIGAFYSTSKLDKLNRKTNILLSDISIYPGYIFALGADFSENDSEVIRMKKMAKAKKIKVGLGLTVAFPLSKNSEGHGVNLNEIKPGVGFSFLTSYTLTNQLNVFFNATRIGRDLDGYAYVNDSSDVRSNGNKHNVSYYYKLGLMRNF